MLRVGAGETEDLGQSFCNMEIGRDNNNFTNNLSPKLKARERGSLSLLGLSRMLRAKLGYHGAEELECKET